MAIGVLLLFSVFLSYSFMMNTNRVSQTQPNLEQDILPVKNYISTCVDSSAEEGLRQIGLNGGYMGPGDIDTVVYKREDVPVYLDSLEPNIPGFDQIEAGLSEMIRVNIGNCVDLSLIESLGFTVSDVGSTSIDVRAGERDTSFVVKSPFKIKRGDSVSEIVGFQTNVPFSIREAHSKAQWFISEVKEAWKESREFDLTGISCDSIDERMRIHSHRIDDTTRVIQIIDYDVSDVELPFLYQFAIRKEPLDFKGDSCS